MPETYEQLICRLRQLRDEMYTTAPGREALAKVRGQLAEMAKAQQRGGVGEGGNSTMREILFKAKRLDNGEWVEGFLEKHPSAIQMPGYSGPWYIWTPPQDPDNNGGVFNVDPETVGQYTGQKDCVGEKIFEGDIVEVESDELGVVEWEEETSRFVISCDGWSTDFDHYYGRELAIVGNKYDSPELPGGEI